MFYLFISLMAAFVPLQASQNKPPAQNEKYQFLRQTLDFAKSHRDFKELYFKANEQLFMDLVAKGQSPKTLFISCSDSRVVPDLILQTKPGELFVIRTAGNFVPTYQESGWGDGVSATVEYAVNALNVKHIIVCGHSHCGAIQGLFKEMDPDKFGLVEKWLRFGKQAKELAIRTKLPGETIDDLSSVAEYVSALYQLEHLMSFPFIKTAVKNGDLHLHAWHYRIETGEVEFYDPLTGQFRSLSKK